MAIIAAADGSALGNPGPAGWAWVIDNDHWRAGGWPRATNNQGELMAVADLLESTAHRADEPLRVLCDSKYVIDSVTKWMPGWKRKGWRKADGKPVLNRELLERIDRALVGRNVQFEWVKGHAGHPLNEAADLRARSAATSFQRGEAVNAGPGFGDGHSGQAEPTAHLLANAGNEERADSIDTLFDFEAQRNPLTEALENERSLLTPAVRANRRLVEALLHPNYREICALGRLWDRKSAIDAMVADPLSDIEFSLIEVSELAPGTVQVVYRMSGSRSVVRSSLWQLDGGAYRLLFHQGTIVD